MLYCIDNVNIILIQLLLLIGSIRSSHIPFSEALNAALVDSAVLVETNYMFGACFSKNIYLVNQGKCKVVIRFEGNDGTKSTEIEVLLFYIQLMHVHMLFCNNYNFRKIELPLRSRETTSF